MLSSANVTTTTITRVTLTDATNQILRIRNATTQQCLDFLNGVPMPAGAKGTKTMYMRVKDVICSLDNADKIKITFTHDETNGFSTHLKIQNEVTIIIKKKNSKKTMPYNKKGYSIKTI